MEKIKSIFIFCLRFVHSIWFRLVQLVKLLSDPKYYRAPSYFPEYERRKSTWRIFFEQLWNIWREGDINEFYFLYGFDVIGFRRQRDYIDNRKFIRQRGKQNQENLVKPICVLRNKFLFGVVADALGVNTPSLVGIIHGNNFFVFAGHKTILWNDFLSQGEFDVFVKDSNGECGEGIFALQRRKGVLYVNKKETTIEEINSRINPCLSFIVQERISQHPALNKIYDKSINTIRLETVINPKTKEIEILPPLLRVGTSGHNVDNWAMGGLAIGIDEKGCLKKYGFYKPSFGTKTTQHPDTEVVFENYSIPFFAEAVDMARRFHSELHEIHSIGWDIAITDAGPCFIEGNDNWEISLVQICSKGLQREFEELFFDNVRL